MKKKHLLLIALGLAASVQAQNAPASAAAAPAAQPAPAVAPAPAPATAPVAEPAPAAAPTDSVAVAEPAPAADSTVADSTAAPAADQVATDSTATPAPADSAVAVAEPAPAADSTVAEPAPAAPADSAVTAPEQVAVVDSAKAVTDSVATDTSKVAKAPVNKLGDILHGNAYNTVGNEAAASTIGGNVGFPHFMFGSKLAYFDPVEQQGVVAFGDSWTYFLSFDNNDEADMGLLTAGIAFQKFGASLDYSLGKAWRWTDHADGTDETEKSSTAGSVVGANFSLNVGSFDILLSGHYATPYGNHFLDQPNSEIEDDAWAAQGYLGVSYSGDVYYWTLGVEGVRNEYKHKTSVSELQVKDGKNYLVTTKTTLSDTLANVSIIPMFTLGAAVLSSENANVYLGLNTFLPMYNYDNIEGISDRHQDAQLVFEPNILGEVQLSKYFMAFGGAKYTWTAAEYSDRELGGEKTKNISTIANGTTVNMGARFDYGPAAVELAFTKQFLANPFSGFAEKDAIVTSLGAFIFF
ncbi:hypothetical protein [Fibrobacter sp.]|uniref:hypothetical protein n=1 Tax=Fibrobacter sp. TaxID=35828 RepID=UPI00388E4CA5